MAERLRSFDFSAPSNITTAGDKVEYDWNNWFDGDIWKLTQGEDFNTEPLMMERIIRTRASSSKHQAKVRVRHVAAENGDRAAIVLQRTDVKGPSEVKKAQQKNKRAAKAAEAKKAADAFVKQHKLAPVKKAATKTPAKKAAAVNGTPSKRPSKKVAAVK